MVIKGKAVDFFELHCAICGKKFDTTKKFAITPFVTWVEGKQVIIPLVVDIKCNEKLKKEIKVDVEGYWKRAKEKNEQSD